MANLETLKTQIKELAAAYKTVYAEKMAAFAQNSPQKTETGNSKSISAPVGNGALALGGNKKADVTLVQALLNKHGATLSTDGACGGKTIQAILDFQTQKFGAGDGRVDVGGSTWKALVGTSSNNGNTNPVNPNPQNNTGGLDPIDVKTTKNPPLKHKAIVTKGNFVGKGKSDNHPEDVKLVKKMLNKRLRINLDVNDGKCDAATIAAIENFQTQNGLGTDGIVAVAGGQTMAPGNTTWKALSGSGRDDMGIPADVDTKFAPAPITNQGIPQQAVICAPKVTDPSALPVLIVVGGMHGYGAQFMVDCVPSSIFAKAVVMGFGYNTNLPAIQKAYLDYFGKPINLANSSICGFSAGGSIAAYSSKFKRAGMIDAVCYGAVQSNMIVSYNIQSAANWAVLAPKYPSQVEKTNIGHGEYPVYFLSKFASQLV